MLKEKAFLVQQSFKKFFTACLLRFVFNSFSFHPSLKFTVDNFDDGIVHCMSKSMGKSTISTSCKTCSTEELLNQRIKNISLFMSWNGFLDYISKALLYRLKSNFRNCDVINEINNNKENETEIFFRLPYAGSIGEQLVKHCLKKIQVA